MRELHLVRSESTGSTLVLESPEGDRYSLAIDEVRSFLAPAEEKSEPRALPLRPRDIQDRIRGGATVSQVAEQMGVPEARVEPYAHPVLLERARIAELAKNSHPVREDGPARLSLWEVLATALAARGEDLTTSRWDAHREAGGQWIVVVTWGEHRAEWTLQNHTSASTTTVARNPVASELMAPPRPAAVAAEEPPAAEEEPQPEPKKRRKAVTPHWEDVLLGVRANTKRPR
ncbi:septation protein SepH [Corynebacterium mastitidis]|uniref:Septation protein SepH n=1 Tax=Corynebacterium mastitidis TaxID=161890 RepID=A0ABU8NYT5_9CORY